MSTSRVSVSILLGLLGLTFLAYVPALSAGFVWDDNDWLTENPAVTDAGGLARIWSGEARLQYYPLLFTVFWIEYHLWGLAPAGYHAVNIFFHACNAFLLGLVLRRLEIRGGWWIAVLFAVHPVHVESVAWITELKNVLSGFFYLSAGLAFLIFDQTRRRGLYVLSLALFACAMLSKTAGVTLPFALALLLLWKKRRLDREDLVRLVPFAVVAAGLAMVTVFLEEGMIDVVREDFGFSWVERIAIAGRALLFYPQKLLLPYPLIFNYPRWDLEAGAWSLAWPVLVVVSIVAVLVALWRRGNRGIVCAAGFYAVTILPALGFFNVYAFRYSFVADHFQYLAGIGILVLIVQAALALGRRAAPGRAGPGRALGSAVVLFLIMLTWNQARAYRDLPALWQDTLAKNPDSWIAHHNLALHYMELGEQEQALEHFDEAIRCKPRAAESYTGRGLAQARRGALARALEDLDRAVELNPIYPLARLNRGHLLVEVMRFEAAIQDLSVFLDANPDHAPAYVSRGRARLGLGDAMRACEDWGQACRLGECRAYDQQCRGQT